MDILSVASEAVQEIFSEVETDASVSLETLEASVSQASRELGRKVLEACFSERAVSESDSASVACQTCGGQTQRLRQRACYIESLSGVLRVSRWVYRCACGVSVVPWDSQEGLKDGAYTLGVAKTMCRLAARLDFREAASELKHHGIRVSHTTLQNKVQRWASGESVSAYVDRQSLEPGSRWYVSCDGCHTPLTQGRQEVKVGCLYRDDPHADPGTIASTRSSSLRYVASRSDAVSFGSQWFDLATASGIYEDETDTEEIVVIGDGAAWIWNLSQEYFPGAVEIVDDMHAKAHLYESAKLAYGEAENTSPKVERWVKATEAFLYAGDIQEVVARIRALGIGSPASVSESLQTQAGYFQKHAHRMQYQRFVENGYQIGSGVIESACKHVVAERCKQAGMRWSQDGINAILFYRCLLKSGAGDTFWQKHPNAAGVA